MPKMENIANAIKGKIPPAGCVKRKNNIGKNGLTTLPIIPIIEIILIHQAAIFVFIGSFSSIIFLF
jgi:hypothetical protein